MLFGQPNQAQQITGELEQKRDLFYVKHTLIFTIICVCMSRKQKQIKKYNIYKNKTYI